jgi:glutamine synthetase adenylyltransferase
MTVPPQAASAKPGLFGSDGELIAVRIAADPRLLEDLLDALACLDFPVNPQLYHQTAQVTVEFPAYSSQIEQVREALRTRGFNAESLELQRVL